MCMRSFRARGDVLIETLHFVCSVVLENTFKTVRFNWSTIDVCRIVFFRNRTLCVQDVLKGQCHDIQ